ncbi:hypothetical protein BCR44DRAFT_33872 [Catenaria anguillulae PL171]|uniref:Uncharacterized protein n=1 Tax=Catenaria anguillulae PL171 TaxID=765915 RepID=A0A1Y2HNA4_9FUNG|nr:hypothetical protein BCR44DRAFT_33872 [Catenaria anguillulae PL171]
MALADVSGDSTLCPLQNTGAAVLQLGPKTNPAIDQEPKPKGKDAGMTSWLIHMNDAASIVSWIAFLSSAFGIGGQQLTRTKPNSRSSSGKPSGGSPKLPKLPLAQVKRTPSLQSNVDPSSPLVVRGQASLKRGSVAESSSAASPSSSLVRSSTLGGVPK